MAEEAETQFSVMSLEDELTCSICLTIPCGHNFCQDCLLESWKDSYSCPQCRTVFATKPELKKNTVLTAVVETFKERSDKSEARLSEEASEAVRKDVIRCDTCMEAEASKTCLTCMASYCEEHLRPHRENPIFRLHQLSEPVGDLLERICTDHHKLMEFFCPQHDRLICSFCLQQVHRGCSFVTLEEQRSLKESDLRNKLGLLNEKMEKTETVVFQMNNVQSKLKDAANKRKTALAAVYQQMRDLLAQDECEAQNEVDRELELDQMKLRDLTKKLNENCEKMGKTREDINSLLSESQTSTFLQASIELPKVIKFEPHVPRINLDSKKVTATQAFEPVEARLLLLKPGQTAAPASGPASAERTGSQPEREVESCPGDPRLPESHSSGPQGKTQKTRRTQIFSRKQAKASLVHCGECGNKNNARSVENLMECGRKEKPRGYGQRRRYRWASEVTVYPQAPLCPPQLSSTDMLRTISYNLAMKRLNTLFNNRLLRELSLADDFTVV